MANIHEAYLRSALFGLQDGIVSTTGVVAGISAGVDDKTVIVMAALVAVMVEASSMAAGQYTSEKAAHELDVTNSHTDNLVLGALIMFVSYFGAGMVPVVPTILLEQPQARYVSIGGAFVALFLVGYVKGKVVNHSAMRSATELLIIGGIATIIGLAVGSLFSV